MVVGNPYRDRWFADPFIVDADDKAITLLVEDFSLQTLKGSISELTIDRATWKICQRRTVLEEPLQLSFPYIVRREGDWVWFMPESSRANRLSLYCYNRADGSCRRERDLVAVDLSDSILLDGYVLATQGEGSTATRSTFIASKERTMWPRNPLCSRSVWHATRVPSSSIRASATDRRRCATNGMARRSASKRSLARWADGRWPRCAD